MDRAKSALFRALCELSVEKGYDNVTVEAILHRADVGRTTFYSRFPNKASLMLCRISDFPCCPGGEGFRDVGKGKIPTITPLLERLNCEAELVRALQRSHVFELAKAKYQTQVSICLEDMLVARSKRPSTDSEIRAMVHFLVGGLVGLVSMWFTDGMREPPEIVDLRFQNATRRIVEMLG